MERWKPVVGHPNYEVSSHGRVRSLDHVVVRYNRGVRQEVKCKGRLLRPAPKKCGHLTVTLGRKSGTKQVHDLVLTAFRGPRPAGKEGLHKDGVPSNNRLRNLRWGTRTENLIDAYRNHQTTGRGSKRPAAKLTDAHIPKIRRRLGRKESYTSIGKRYGVSAAAISQIARGLTWTHV